MASRFFVESLLLQTFIFLKVDLSELAFRGIGLRYKLVDKRDFI